MAVTIKKVESDTELEELAVLADEIWHECFINIISIGQIDYMVEKFQSYEAMTKQIAEQYYSYYAVREDGELCGYMGVKPEKDSRFFLSKLYLRKDKRGKGIASQMLARVFEGAKACGKKQVYLTVNKHNDRAIAVYKKVGFKVIDEVVTDIGNGYVMDDYIFGYDL
ncbi:GNAT family N-acetyltransferase [Ruminococcus flavefaciens]|uniref:Acetyltransferase (GNAT) family protein n=1 Tax=Ruminococcus flavefaciens TaxID=1265 RepID=A0A1M7KN68_RUMFL|nr:GNAT family N-acetyltransferase [Ruminococcus flavefaciens]SHM66834.1 Acetyltransferase (GNAT) family protein [Ruminococcus flavefaciens]